MDKILKYSLRKIRQVLQTKVQDFGTLQLDKYDIEHLKEIANLGPNIKPYLHKLKLQGKIKTKQSQEKLELKVKIDETNEKIKELEGKIEDFERESAEYKKEKSHTKKEQDEYAKYKKEYNANKKELKRWQKALSSLKDMLEKWRIQEQE